MAPATQPVTNQHHTGRRAQEQTGDKGPVMEKIKINTSRFGEVEVDQSRVITMTSPFLGFPESRRFFLQPHGGESPFMWLQSMEEKGLAFVVISPALLFPNYCPPIAGYVKDELEVGDDKDLDLLVILTVPKGRPQDMTANLLAPVLVNIKTRLARQILLDPTKYDPCWPVFVEE